MRILLVGLVGSALLLSGCTGREIDAFFGGSERFHPANNVCQHTAGDIRCSPHNGTEAEDHGTLVVSDLRLKRDVALVGTLPNGIHLYAFNYAWGGPRYIGVIAQDVLKLMPEAVTVDQYGFYRVDYSMVGTRMVLASERPLRQVASADLNRAEEMWLGK